MNPERFFFDTDSDGHWYMVPASMAQQWSDLNFDFNDDDAEEFIALFNVYRIDGHPNSFTFADPKDVRL